jgi:hypothetical protein
VWQRLPPDAVPATAGLLYSLAAGQSHDVETISWGQRDLHGRQVEPGRYEVQGIFYGRVAYSGHSEIQSDTVSLLIERNPMLNMEVVTPAYFETFGMPVIRGRRFTDQDREGGPAVVLVNQSAARHCWPGEDPLGKHLRMGEDRA